MWDEFAKDSRMRRNIGIGRRLAPLVDNDRRVAELLYAMLFSMPGSPVLYYGDEISMGDNLELGDRASVRTPMQWSPGPNAGFSGADPTDLYLPLLTDPVHGHQAANVEAETRDTSSMLHWMRRTLAIRAQHPVLGKGSFKVIQASNPSVLAYVRQDRSDAVLCVNNLSRFAQASSLPLQRFEGRTPMEMRGRVPFPAIGENDYFMTLGPYGTYWLELVSRHEH